MRSRPGQFVVIKNGWGAQGWTTLDLALVDEASLNDALRAAHGLAKPAPKKATTQKAAKKTTTQKAPKKATKQPS